MITEKEDIASEKSKIPSEGITELHSVIDYIVRAYHRGYRLGFLDGKDVGYEEGLDAGLDQTR